MFDPIYRIVPYYATTCFVVVGVTSARQLPCPVAILQTPDFIVHNGQYVLPPGVTVSPGTAIVNNCNSGFQLSTSPGTGAGTTTPGPLPLASQSVVCQPDGSFSPLETNDCLRKFP